MNGSYETKQDGGKPLFVTSALCGGPNVRPAIDPLEKEFSRIFDSEISKPFLKSIESILFAKWIAGPVLKCLHRPKFGRVAHRKKTATVTTVFILYESEWYDQSMETIRTNLSAGYRECFARAYAWLRRHEEFINEQGFVDLFERGMEEFDRAVPVPTPAVAKPSNDFLNRMWAWLAEAGVWASAMAPGPVIYDDAISFNTALCRFLDHELATGAISAAHHEKMITYIKRRGEVGGGMGVAAHLANIFLWKPPPHQQN